MRLAPYSFCSLDKGRNYISDWKTDRKKVLSPEHAPSFISAWLQKGAVRAVVRGTEDGRLFKLDGAMHMLAVRKHYSTEYERRVRAGNTASFAAGGAHPASRDDDDAYRHDRTEMVRSPHYTLHHTATHSASHSALPAPCTPIRWAPLTLCTVCVVYL